MTKEDANDLAALKASILELHNSIGDLRRDPALDSGTLALRTNDD